MSKTAVDIALVSRHHGTDGAGQAVRISVLVVTAVTLPLVALLFGFSTPLIGPVSDNAAAVTAGMDYLRIVALGVPFVALNLIGSRVFIGVGELPIYVDLGGPYLDAGVARDITSIGALVVGRSMVWTVAEFPMLAIGDAFGVHVVAAYAVARRIWGIMNTPGWGFRLASSSLVGQSLGAGEEREAEACDSSVSRHAVWVSPVSAVFVGSATATVSTQNARSGLVANQRVGERLELFGAKFSLRVTQPRRRGVEVDQRPLGVDPPRRRPVRRLPVRFGNDIAQFPGTTRTGHGNSPRASATGSTSASRTVPWTHGL